MPEVSMPPPPVSLVMTAYQQERFAGEAARSVLAQDYPDLDIILSDDASTDATFAAIAREADAYRGPHRVRVNRNPVRQGIVHVEAISNRMPNDIIVIAHGDDIAQPWRVRRQVEAMLDTGAALVASEVELIDAEGVGHGLLEGSGRSRAVPLAEMVRTGWQRTMLGATFAHRRAVRSRFRPMTPTSPPSYDHILPARAAILSMFYFIAEPLVRYRRHASNAGHYLADHSGPRALMQETAEANGLCSLGGLLGDVDGLPEAQTGRPDMAAVRGILRRAAVGRVDRLVDQRLALMRAGFAPHWIPLGELAGKPLRDENLLKPNAPSGGA